MGHRIRYCSNSNNIIHYCQFVRAKPPHFIFTGKIRPEKKKKIADKTVVEVGSYAAVLLHFTHCLSFRIQQRMIPMGKRRRAAAMPAGG